MIKSHFNLIYKKVTEFYKPDARSPQTRHICELISCFDCDITFDYNIYLFFTLKIELLLNLFVKKKLFDYFSRDIELKEKVELKERWEPQHLLIFSFRTC
jgi:hypothetical protein